VPALAVKAGTADREALGLPLRRPSLICEHPFVMFADALLLLFELADKEDERFQAAAARWHAGFVLEANLPLREAEGAMTLLCRLRGADRHIVRRRLLLSVERAGLTTREIS
jgi:hypothetical protein